MSNDLNAFREEVGAWLAENIPAGIKGASMGLEGELTEEQRDGFELWRQRLAEKGWGAPTWPKEYGGAGLSHPEAKVIRQEMGKAGVFNHISIITGMGITMVGPTVLEYGTEEQKARHLPGIASGEVRWCGPVGAERGLSARFARRKAEDNGGPA